jgi:hypothetical protein
MLNELIGSSAAIKTWLPMSLATAAISFILISLFTSIPVERAIVGSLLAAALVFSGCYSDPLVKRKSDLTANEQERKAKIILKMRSKMQTILRTILRTILQGITVFSGALVAEILLYYGP